MCVICLRVKSCLACYLMFFHVGVDGDYGLLEFLGAPEEILFLDAVGSL